MNDWWDEIDSEILEALQVGPMTPAEVGRHVGMSEQAAASLLWYLASQDRIRICLVELVTREGRRRDHGVPADVTASPF